MTRAELEAAIGVVLDQPRTDPDRLATIMALIDEYLFRGRSRMMFTMELALMCPVCMREIGRGPADLMAGVYLMHCIDEHWHELERIRATTGDDDARLQLCEQMAAERAAYRNRN